MEEQQEHSMPMLEWEDKGANHSPEPLCRRLRGSNRIAEDRASPFPVKAQGELLGHCIKDTELSGEEYSRAQMSC